MSRRTPGEIQILDWILTEIEAGMCLRPLRAEEHAWNNAHERCKAIIANYRTGEGLFEMTAKAKARASKGGAA